MRDTFAAEAYALAWNSLRMTYSPFPLWGVFVILISLTSSHCSCHIIQFTFTVTLQLSQFPLSAGIILSLMQMRNLPYSL